MQSPSSSSLSIDIGRLRNMAKKGILALSFLSICNVFNNVNAFMPSGWYSASATFYGNSDASGTMSGACGYGNTYVSGYGVATTALSTPLFNRGASCGSCYRIVCDYSADPRFCYKNKAVTVTAIDFCPPGSYGGWCDPPQAHFDMSEPSFLKIGVYIGGVVPVKYQRVPCKKHGGVRFTINGNVFFLLVLITNVGGAGSIQSVYVRGSRPVWIYMPNNWGANWQTNAYLVGQPLTFKVITSDGAVRTFPKIAPSGWYIGQTFSSLAQFKS